MKKYFAEGLGTCVLVLMGCGSAVIAGDKVGFLGISFAFGITVLVLAYAIGRFSGCHVNPAVTLAMFLMKKITGTDAIGYVIAQIVGATVGAFLLWQIALGNPSYSIATAGLGQNGFDTLSPGHYSMSAALVTETIFTAVFILIILASTAKGAYQKFSPIAIGLALFVIHVVTIPVTGTSVNPARSIGPALLVGGEAMSQLWLFILGPLLGAMFATLLWRILTEEKDPY